MGTRISTQGLARLLRRVLSLLVVAGVSLQLYFLLATLTLAAWQPPSTTFQRTAIWDNLAQQRDVRWRHTPVADAQIANHARRAVIASEDNHFATHRGADWAAIRSAWERNIDSERVLGGSTITQQLAKNLYLSSERSLLRKGQELLLAWMLEATLSKQRILNLYLNQVEWGDSLYGIEAAAQHYFQTNAAQLSAAQAARLAVMLPQPRRLGSNPHSRYMNQRTQTILRRMQAVHWPPAR